MTHTAIVLTLCGMLTAPAAFAGHMFEGRDIAAGQVLYGEACASCHGADLEGQPNWRSPGPDGVLPAPPHNETGHTWHHDTGLLFEYVRFGGAEALRARGVTGFKSGMPAFGDQYSDDQIMDILAYIRSTWPQRVQRVQEERTHQ